MFLTLFTGETNICNSIIYTKIKHSKGDDSTIYLRNKHQKEIINYLHVEQTSNVDHAILRIESIS